MRHHLVLAAVLLTSVGCDTAGFSDAYMSLDSAGKRRREHFFTDTENIYCFGKLASGVDDLTVSGTLRAEQIYDPRNGTPVDVDFYLGTEDQAPGAGKDITVAFLLEHDESDEPYTAGKFVCELGLDGEVVERLPFEIEFPTCPEAPIFTGAVCAGFVLQGAQCQGALADTCTCQEDGVWSCR
jgi:hypothetical protein